MKSQCYSCDREVDSSEMIWVTDRYNIPYKKVCWNCEDSVREEIADWEFNSLDAGESLEED